MAGNALYDVGMRLRAAELHDEGHGPRGDRGPSRDAGGNRERMAVHLQVCWYRGSGHDGKEAHRLFVRDEAGRRQAVVDEGMTKPEAMEKFGIASPSPFKKWLKAYRRRARGAQAKAKGEAEGSGSPSGRRRASRSSSAGSRGSRRRTPT